MRPESLGEWTILVPTGPRERRRGLLGRDHLDPFEALWFPRCRSVHTFGMRFSIDVVTLDRTQQPLAVYRLLPSRLLLPRHGVWHIVEVAAGRGDAFRAALVGRTTRDGRGIARRERR